MLQLLGAKGEAVVLYRKPLTTTEMWYPRRLPENEIFFPRSRKAKIITTGIH